LFAFLPRRYKPVLIYTDIRQFVFAVFLKPFPAGLKLNGKVCLKRGSKCKRLGATPARTT
jgi:hypothetical protein